jgi:excisionase family DNA binding protein
MLMVSEKEYLRIAGHVPVKEAAEMLGISEDRVLQHIKAKRLPGRKVMGRYMIPLEAVEQFKLNPPGRLRTKAPAWRSYHARSKLFGMDIQVEVQPGQQEHLLKKLSVVLEENRHTFAGTIARYILKDGPSFTTLSFWFIWKDSEMPDELTRERDFEAFKAEFADVLKWETAHISVKEGIIYT